MTGKHGVLAWRVPDNHAGGTWFRSGRDVVLALEPAYAGTEGFQRPRDLLGPMGGRDQSARRAHDVDAVRQHRNTQPVALPGVARALELLEPVPQRIEGLRVDVETLRILEDQKRRGVAIDAPGHV